MNKYGVDNNGYIVSQVDEKKIQIKHKSAIDDVVGSLLNICEKYIHSIYVYGSVATGKAKDKVSDLDILLVVNKKSSELKKIVKKLELSLSDKYTILFRDIGIELTDLPEIDADYYGFGCFIKHLCLNVYGQDLRNNYRLFKPCNSVAIAFNGDIESYLEAVNRDLTISSSDEKIISIYKSAMRKFLRTGFSLVMEKEDSWTTDLTESYNAFIKYYPDKQKEMEYALDIVMQNRSIDEETKIYLNRFGNWLIKRVKLLK